MWCQPSPAAKITHSQLLVLRSPGRAAAGQQGHKHRVQGFDMYILAYLGELSSALSCHDCGGLSAPVGLGPEVGCVRLESLRIQSDINK